MSDSEEDSQPPRRRPRFTERLDNISQLSNEAATEEAPTQNTSRNAGSSNGRLEHQLQQLMTMSRNNADNDNIQDQLRGAFPTLQAREERNDRTVTIPRMEPGVSNPTTGRGRKTMVRNPQDGRKATDISMKLTALDNPEYTSTAVVNLVELRRKGLGRPFQGSMRIPGDSSVDEFRELVRTTFPVLRDHNFEVLVGRRGCKLELVPIPDADHIKDLRVCRSPVPLWIRPTSVVTQIPEETEDSETDTGSQSEDREGDIDPPLEDREDDTDPPLEDREGDIDPPLVDREADTDPPLEDREGDTDPPLADREADTDPPLEDREDDTDPPLEDREDENLRLHLDVSAEENTVPSGYVEAGTPTVLLRTAPRTIMDVTRDVASTEVQPAEEDIPVVQTSNNASSVTVTSGFKERVREHATLFIRGGYDDPLSLEVRRTNALNDALQYIRVAQEDLNSPLLIRFLGEEGVDLGGLRREFWALFLHQVTHSSLVAGRPGRLTFRRNFIEQKKSTYFYLGQMAALSILQDGPGLPIFADRVVNHILERHELCVDEGDLPEHIQQLIHEMNQTDSNEELRQKYEQLMEEANEAGFLVPATRFKKAHLPSLIGAIVENLVQSCRVELEQFLDGLKTHQVLEMMRLEPDASMVLLSGRRKAVTVAAIRELLKIQYRDGNLGEVDRQTAHGFLTFLQATKGSTAAVNGLKLSPEDVLMWLTGSAAIPAVGFHKLIDVEFGNSCRVNTCALVVTLTQLPPSVEDVVQYYTGLVINSQTFQVQ